MPNSLYDELGGFSAVRRLVSDFYDRVLEEDELAPFFEATDMAHLIDHQTKFWTTLLGGPASYTHEQLRKIHATMGIENRHFDQVAELARETLEDHDIDEEHARSFIENLASYRSCIVIEKNSDG